MPEKDSLAYLETQLAEQITGFDDSRRFYRRQLFRFTLSTAGLSGVTTICIALEKMLKFEGLTIVSLICSVSITVIAAWDQFLRSRELWVQKTDTWMELQNLDAHLKYSKSKYPSLTQAQIDEFYNRFDKIIMGEHEAWKKVRSTTPTVTTSRRSK